MIETYPWLREYYQHLCHLKQDNKLPHALMFYGTQGVGKEQLAQHFITHVLCQNPQSNQPCFACKSCHLNQSGTHPDAYILEPEKDNGIIKIDQIRELSQFIYSSAHQAGYRVVLINPADGMNTAASNALLKMLEEPGEKTLIILLSNSLQKMLPTIISRCQKINIKALSWDESLKFCQSKLDLEQDKIELLLKLNNAAPLATIRAAEEQQDELRTLFIQGLADILKGRSTLVKVAEQWQKLDIELLLAWFYSLLLDMARAKSTEETNLQHKDAYNMLLAVNRKAPLDNIFALAEEVQLERKQLLLTANPNKQMLLERILLGWLQITLDKAD